jgi:hypothetical protein
MASTSALVSRTILPKASCARADGGAVRCRPAVAPVGGAARSPRPRARAARGRRPRRCRRRRRTAPRHAVGRDDGVLEGDAGDAGGRDQAGRLLRDHPDEADADPAGLDDLVRRELRRLADDVGPEDREVGRSATRRRGPRSRGRTRGCRRPTPRGPSRSARRWPARPAARGDEGRRADVVAGETKTVLGVLRPQRLTAQPRTPGDVSRSRSGRRGSMVAGKSLMPTLLDGSTGPDSAAAGPRGHRAGRARAGCDGRRRSPACATVG